MGRRLAEISDGLEAAELTTVSIAAHYSVERAEVDVLIIVELLGQQNHASAGAKHRFAGLDVGGDRLEQAGGTQEFALRGGFTARQDDPVDGFIEILGRAQQLPRGAEFVEHRRMFGERALHGQNTGHAVRGGFGVCGFFFGNVFNSYNHVVLSGFDSRHSPRAAMMV